MSLGDKIQRLRKEYGLSQEQLSEKLKVSRQAISKWELDETTPDIENIIQLSQVFGVSSDYLLGLDSEIMYKANKNEKSDRLEKTFMRLRTLSICLMIIGFGIVFMLWLISILNPVIIYRDEKNYSEGFSAFLEYYNLYLFNSSMIAISTVGVIILLVASVAIYVRNKKSKRI